MYEHLKVIIRTMLLTTAAYSARCGRSKKSAVSIEGCVERRSIARTASHGIVSSRVLIAPTSSTGIGGAPFVLIPEEQVIVDDGEDLYPPDNFAMVDAGVYRSSFPMKKHFPFLRRLRLKTVLTLVMESYPPANEEFHQAEGIRLIQVGVDGNKEPFKYIPHEDIVLAVNAIRGETTLLMLACTTCSGKLSS
eukprot:20085-Heterococcus_DN1.PRE.3